MPCLKKKISRYNMIVVETVCSITFSPLYFMFYRVKSISFGTVYVGHIVQVGVTSWGVSCADSVHPGVWTDVHQFLPWLRGRLQAAADRLGRWLQPYTVFGIWSNFSNFKFEYLSENESNEIFDIQFFHNSNLPGPLTNQLKYFRFWLIFR